ncbi:MAG TPA: TerB family tellurite resistance protein [Nitrospirae bacterium]|nr:TerB family tellurite resistance protein [Nitrospirota bacterium]
MIRAIKRFFENNIQSPPDSSGLVSEHSLQLATAALLIEMMRADSKIGGDERNTITKSIRSKFDLSEEETNTLLQLAEEEIHKATGYYEFTYLINKGFSYEQKVKVIEHLWEVAFADAVLDKYEEHMVRKIADLIFVEHKDFIKAKLRARDKNKLK